MIDYYNPHFLFSTFFGIGKVVKKGAGTIGSLIAFPIAFMIFRLSFFLYDFIYSEQANIENATLVSLIILAVLIVISCFTAGRYSKISKDSDPKEVIIDEIVGQSLVIITTIPFTFGLIIMGAKGAAINFNFYECFFVSCLAAFLLFRIFDIFKPWPINFIEKSIKGGLGIVADDLAAAILSIIFYYFILFYIVIDRLIN
ncbi:MAG: phosphatidylglycerophosphatase A [Rickettsiales bacterium]